MSHEKLVRMANQIGAFFKHHREDEAVHEIAEHIKSFWEKRMREQIFAHLEAGGEGLHERVKAALDKLKTH
jgi:formate dehydrogenase subunit delta